jgi:uncharacterized repeat protein (TIGR01451 family)
MAMKRLLPILVSFIFSYHISYSQGIYDFTATDIDGNFHDIQAYLADNRPVLIYDFNQFSGQLWLVHEDGVPIDIYNQFGEGGSGDVVVLYIAGEGFQTVDDLTSIDYSPELGPGYENVDLTENNSIPIIIAADNPEVESYPKPNAMWICPDGNEIWLPTSPLPQDVIMNQLYQGCCTELGPLDLAISWNNLMYQSDCDPTVFEYQLQNLSGVDVEEVTIDIFQNGDYLESDLITSPLPGCSSIDIEYTNQNFQGGDQITIAIGQANAFQYNDTILLNLLPVDTAGTKIKLELLNADGTSVYMNYSAEQGFFGEVSASTNWFNYLFLSPGCHRLQVGLWSAFPDPGTALIGSVDDNDNYVDTIFYGNFEGEEVSLEYELFIEGPPSAQQTFGYVFEDINEVSIFSPELPRIEGIQVDHGPYTTFTDVNGYYEFPEVIPGENTFISYDELVWPVYTTPSAGDLNNNQYFQNFGLNSNDPVWELTDFYNTGLPYLCEGAIWNSITVINTGNQEASGELVFTHDFLLTPVSFDPLPASIDGNEITFYIPEVSYGSSENFYILYEELPADLLGEEIMGSFVISTFDDDGNTVNVDDYSSSDTLFCSYDPNDKYGFPLGLGDEGLIEEGASLKYRIRFQNTGNFPASTVIIRDTLPEELNWESFVPLSSSHDYSIMLNSDDREVVWTFQNIMLPDSASDPVGSIGNVWYEIEMNDLEPGDQIKNRAYIYFDQNEAILTNTSLHTISDILSVSETNTDDLVVYPNPATDRIYFKNFLSENATVRITDLSGRLVLIESMDQGFIDVSSLKSGMYLLSIKSISVRTFRIILAD